MRHSGRRKTASARRACPPAPPHPPRRSPPPPQLQALVYDILPSTTAVFSYAIGSRKLSANEEFFVVQTVVSLLQTSQIISDVCFITMLFTPAQIKPESFESRRSFGLLFFLFFFSFLFTRGGCITCLRACLGARLGARLLPQSYQSANSKHWFTTSFIQPLPYLVTP